MPDRDGGTDGGRKGRQAGLGSRNGVNKGKGVKSTELDHLCADMVVCPGLSLSLYGVIVLSAGSYGARKWHLC